MGRNLTVVDQSGAPGPFRVVAREFDFGDDDFDIDEDGRFNQHDVDTLLLAIPTNDESYVSRWDFDGDGTVTGDDANVLQLLIDSGLGSGVFGDLNDDGVPDCSNIAGLMALTGHELGDNNYDVRLDYNLDGLTNQVDRSALINATCIVRGDLNCDGTVNPFDIQPFFTLLDDPTAYSAGFPGCNPLHGDASCDGSVNPFDIQPFLQCVVSRGCTCP